MTIKHSKPREMPFTKEQWEKSMELDPDKYYPKTVNNFYNECKYKPLSIKTLQEKPHFIGIDTETYNSNGNLIVLCNSENEHTLLRTDNSQRQFTLDEYYSYFVKCSRKKNNVCFMCWNLKFDASIILKSLTEQQLELLDEEGEIKINNLKINYIPKKCMTLYNRKQKQSVKIYDAMQFYISSLDKASETYIGQTKSYTGIYQDKKFPDTIDETELNEIIKYCQLDCKLTSQLMELWTEKFYKSFKFYPKQYYSVGSIAVTYLRTQLDYMPAFEVCSYEVQQMAYEAYFGGHFEIYSRGKHKNIYHYDINSAYPFAMVNMPDFLNGKWIKIKSLKDFLKHQNHVGFYKIHTIVNEERISPFLFRDAENLIKCPSGEFITNITSMELKVAISHYDIEIKFIQGYCFIPSKQQDKSFGNLLTKMYKERLKQKDPLQKTVYKFLINSLYGKFAQSKPKPRGLFSPICCSYITGYCRAMLLDAIKDNKEDIVMLATDGIFSTKPLNVNTKGKKILGNWESEFHPRFYLVMAGIYSYNNYCPHSKNKSILNPDGKLSFETELESKSRGFGLTTYNTETGKKDRFDFLDAKVYFENNEFFFKILTLRPLSIKHSLIQNSKSPKNIGRMDTFPKEINLNGDKKRIWYYPLNTLEDYSDSTTIEMFDE